jgi:hypothetical protein
VHGPFPSRKRRIRARCDWVEPGSSLPAKRSNPGDEGPEGRLWIAASLRFAPAMTIPSERIPLQRPGRLGGLPLMVRRPLWRASKQWSRWCHQSRVPWSVLRGAALRAILRTRRGWQARATSRRTATSLQSANARVDLTFWRFDLCGDLPRANEGSSAARSLRARIRKLIDAVH